MDIKQIKPNITHTNHIVIIEAVIGRLLAVVVARVFVKALSLRLWAIVIADIVELVVADLMVDTTS